MGGDALSLVDDLVGRDQQRGAPHRRYPRAAGAETEGEAVGVALHEPDFLRVQPEPVAQELREGRRVALTLGRRAAQHGRAARRRETDLREFQSRRRGALDGVGDSETEKLSVARRVAPPLLEAVRFGKRQRAIHVGLEIARVVDEAERGGERELFAADHVAAAQLHAVDAEIFRRRVDQPFDHERRLRPSRAAIGRGRLAVAERAAHLDMGGGRPVDAGERAEIIHCRPGAEG